MVGGTWWWVVAQSLSSAAAAQALPRTRCGGTWRPGALQQAGRWAAGEGGLGWSAGLEGWATGGDAPVGKRRALRPSAGRKVWVLTGDGGWVMVLRNAWCVGRVDCAGSSGIREIDASPLAQDRHDRPRGRKPNSRPRAGCAGRICVRGQADDDEMLRADIGLPRKGMTAQGTSTPSGQRRRDHHQQQQQIPATRPRNPGTRETEIEGRRQVAENGC